MYGDHGDVSYIASRQVKDSFFSYLMIAYILYMRLYFNAGHHYRFKCYGAASDSTNHGNSASVNIYYQGYIYRPIVAHASY